MKLIAILSYFFIITSLRAQSPVNVAFISPNPKDSKNEFWTITTSQMKYAAKDLGISLEVLYSNSHPTYYYNEVKKIVNRPEAKRPNYLVLLPTTTIISELLSLVERTNIKIMFVNVQVSQKDRVLVGGPREKYKNWIGSFYPDEEQGAELAAREVGKYCKAGSNLVTINGNYISNSSVIREKTFARVIKELGQNLKQSLNGYWKKDRVLKMLPYIEGRYPNLCGFLVASDYMAEAIVDSKHHKYKVCSIDWTSNGIRNVMEKKQVCSVGGHYLEPAFALVALFDYHKGIDFKEDIGLNLKTPFYIANQKNATKVYESFILNKVSLNYKKYSKFYTKRKRYNFNIFDDI